MRSGLPNNCGFRPVLFQNGCDTITGNPAAPGFSSSGVNVRPNSGETPSVEK